MFLGPCSHQVKRVQKSPAPKKSHTWTNVLAHLKKVHILFSVYDALQRPQELRELPIQALLNLQKYQGEMVQLIVACLQGFHPQMIRNMPIRGSHSAIVHVDIKV